MIFVLIGISAHPVWLGLIFSYLFGYRRTSSRSRATATSFDPTARINAGARAVGYHMVLPWFTFGLLFAALYARMIRASVLETMEEDYVRTARAKGASECARSSGSTCSANALMPVVTMLGMDIGVSRSPASSSSRPSSGCPGSAASCTERWRRRPAGDPRDLVVGQRR